MPRCRVCGEFDGLSFECNYCGVKHCVAHRLPEKHSCHALRRRPSKKQARKSVRSRDGRAVGSGPEYPPPDPPAEEQRDVVSDRLPAGAYRFFERVGEVIVILIVYPIVLSLLLLRMLFSRRGFAIVVVSVLVLGGYSAAYGTGFSPIDDTVDDVVGGMSGTIASIGNSTDRPTPTPSQDPAGEYEGADGTPQFTDPPPSAGSGGDASLNQTRIATAVHEAVNEERRSHHLFPFEYDENLERIAEYHSENMAEHEFFSHTSPDGETVSDRYDRFQYHCNAGEGENIAYTYADANVVTESGTVNYRNNETAIGYGLVRQWMNSEGHRENVLRDRWDDEGIGIAVRETSGGTRVYATQNFC